MIRLVVALVLCSPGASSDRDDRALVAVVRNAYESNRTAVSAHGEVQFHFAGGEPGRARDPSEFEKLLKGDWTRHSVAKGYYVFDGPLRRYDHAQSLEQMVARRVMISKSSWTSDLFSYRILTDGESTLQDGIDVSADGKTLLHNPNIYAGDRKLFSVMDFPLKLGDGQPSVDHLGGCLARLLEGPAGLELSQVDESASLGGTKVLLIRFRQPAFDTERTFWIDMEHGAIPLQWRIQGPKRFTQFNHGDIRWVGPGWFPFRYTFAFDSPTDAGELPNPSVREVVIDEAEFEKRPDRGKFRMEFSKDYTIYDVDRLKAHPARSVWDLASISRTATAQARTIRLATGPTTPPVMPGPNSRNPWISWGFTTLGTVVLIGVAVLAYRWSRGHG